MALYGIREGMDNVVLEINSSNLPGRSFVTEDEER